MRVTDTIRSECARVAQAARSVRICHDRIPQYAESLSPSLPPLEVSPADPEHREELAAFWLTLDAINFGSGWFPTLRKSPGATGYRTIAGRLRRRLDEHGPWSSDELTVIMVAEVAEVFGQDPTHELMRLFTTSLRDLGAHVTDAYAGSFTTVVDRAAGSAPALVETLSEWDCFLDTSLYDGRAVPFFKRAQIATADLHRSGVVRLDGIEELTLFADNLVPHVLRLDGVLEFASHLTARIEREVLLEHGSPEEVEIRACAVHAVELLVRASAPGTTAMQLDDCLWNRGQQPRYKAVPRHRARTTAY